jgi:hypothetical protein
MSVCVAFFLKNHRQWLGGVFSALQQQRCLFLGHQDNPREEGA